MDTHIAIYSTYIHTHTHTHTHTCDSIEYHIILLQNAALCALLGLSLFAGGVANGIYVSNNAETIDDISDICDQPTDISNDLCHALERVRDSEAALAVSN